MCDKATYGNLTLALLVAGQVSRRFGVQPRAYRCPDCGLWHLARIKWRGGVRR